MKFDRLLDESYKPQSTMLQVNAIQAIDEIGRYDLLQFDIQMRA